MDTSYRDRSIGNPLLKVPLLKNEDGSVHAARKFFDQHAEVISEVGYQPPKFPGSEGHSISLTSANLPQSLLDHNKGRENFTSNSDDLRNASSLKDRKIEIFRGARRSLSTTPSSEKSKSSLGSQDVLRSEKKPRLSQQDKNEIALSELQHAAGDTTYTPPAVI